MKAAAKLSAAGDAAAAVGHLHDGSELGGSQSHRISQDSPADPRAPIADLASSIAATNSMWMHVTEQQSDHQNADDASGVICHNSSELRTLSRERLHRGPERQHIEVSVVTDVPPAAHRETATVLNEKAERGVTAADDGRR